jgi:hypothetical protein
LPNRTTASKPPLAVNRYGSLDVPLSVWTVEGPDDLVEGLLIELAPTGPVAAIDLPGWTALPLAGRATRLFWRTRATHTALATLSDAARQRTTAYHATRSTLAAKLTTEQRLGMVAASSWLLRCPGGLDAAADALRPGGSLVVVGRTEQDAVDIATLIDTSASPKLTGALDFAAYLVAASTMGLDAAVRAAYGETATAARHWVAGVWCKRELRAGARG